MSGDTLPVNAIRAIGRTAHAALVASGGRFAALPGGGDCHYARANGEIIWIGHGDAALHPRAVVLDRPVGRADGIQVNGISPWAPRIDGHRAHALVSGCGALMRNFRAVGKSAGFAAMLIGETPPFPLDSMSARVVALARACRAGDADAFHDDALPLLGFGPGLTPSGDDLVGGMLFARRALGVSWDAAAARLCAACADRTHPVSAALFRDLADGESFAPLHRLVSAVGDHDGVLAAAREVASIGHCSGFDMLAGLLIGATGRIHSSMEIQ